MCGSQKATMVRGCRSSIKPLAAVYGEPKSVTFGYSNKLVNENPDHDQDNFDIMLVHVYPDGGSGANR